MSVSLGLAARSERDPVSERDPTTPEVTSEYLRDLESFRGRLKNFAERDDD